MGRLVSQRDIWFKVIGQRSQFFTLKEGSMGWVIWFIIVSLAGVWLGIFGVAAFVLWCNRVPLRDAIDAQWDGRRFHVTVTLRPPKGPS